MIPAYILAQLEAYKAGNHPYEFGSFLTAVLANDLVEASCRADSTNKHLLNDYGQYLLTLPRHMWGSYEAVEECINTQRNQMRHTP